MRSNGRDRLGHDGLMANLGTFFMSDIRGYILTVVLTLAAGIALGGIVSLWGEAQKAGMESRECLLEEGKPETEIISD